ncbi:MAG: TIGR02556 family CRISPR-associated protein [Calditrichaceae bacterium]
MINKIKLLGEYSSKLNIEDNPYGLNTTLKEGNVILLNFELTAETCRFSGADLAQFDQQKNKKYLLKNAKGNKVSEFPTIYADLSKVGDFSKSLKKLQRILNDNALINQDLVPLVAEFESKTDRLQESIGELVDKSKTTLLSVTINGQPAGDSPQYESVRNAAIAEGDRDYFEKYSSTSIGENAICYVCGEQKPKVYGFVSTYRFYSSNEFAYIAGGFKKENSWMNYPVCPSCAKKLKDGANLADQHFNYRLRDNRYFLLPAPLLDKNNFEDVLDLLVNEYKQINLRRNDATQREQYIELEEEIFERLAEQNDTATFTMFFYEINNSEFKIFQEIEEILPSGFKKVIEAENLVNEIEEFQDLVKDKDGHKHHLRFSFDTIRTFFDKSFNKDFLAVVAAIFKGRLISKQFILHRISDHLSEGFRREEMYYDFFKAMQFMKFLYRLGLIQNESLKKEAQMEGMYEDYFNKHPDFFDADIKKAVFLEGLLVQKLLNIQHTERGSTPFRSRLNGLKIDGRIVRRLLPEAIDKLEQYKKNYYRDLESQISALLVSGEPDLKKMSVDEISFYFTMGMNLAKQFKNEEKKGEENE